jgi:hypothetical protein
MNRMSKLAHSNLAASGVLVAVTAALIGVVAAPAWAEPSGCGHTTQLYANPTGGGRYEILVVANGNCSTTANRTLHGEIHAKGFPTDPLVASQDQNATATSYEVRVTSCDHGNTKNYYGRSFFTSSVSYVDTPVYQVAACS